MIQRINHIQCVGVFSDFRGGGSVPLADTNKLSVIFGRNTVGKTTLTTIFQSLGLNRPELIIERTSIPSPSGLSPSVQIGYLDKAGKRKVVNFKADLWEKSDLVGRILVFDQGFIHRNLITGTEVTRENKEEFTNFILGEEGVKLSDGIEKQNKELRIKRMDLRALRPPFAVNENLDEPDTKSFTELIVDESQEDLRKERERIEKTLLRLEKASDFNSLPAFSLIPIEALASLKSLEKDTAVLMQKSYKNITVAVTKKMSEHIKSHCADAQGAELWLKKGLGMVKGERCPFCSQSLDPVKDLIASYELMFNKEFEEYEATIQSSINTVLDQVDALFAYSPVTLISEPVRIAKQYEPYLDGIIDNLEELEKISTDIQDLELKIREELTPFKKHLIDNINKKKSQSIYPFTPAPPQKTLNALYRTTDEKFTQANKIIKKLSEAAEEKRKKVSKLDPEQLADLKKRYKSDFYQITRRQQRLIEDSHCRKYEKSFKEIEELTKMINDNRKRLEREQSEYLDKYFNDLNILFDSLGSSNFKLILSTSNRGDRKTYFLTVTYRGREVDQDQISKVFSESDKRSLALAIFLSKLKHLDEKNKKIIVLDDPVVSFDEDRIDQTIRLVKELSGDYSQILIITHYLSLLKKISSQTKDVCYSQITWAKTGSILTACNIRNLILTPHERDFEKILNFISGDNDIDVRRLLRPFMEDHLRLIYAKQIGDNRISHNIQLKDFIDKLFDSRCFDEDIKVKLHCWRESLNPDLHTSPVDENPSATRVDARNLFKLLYEDIFS